MTRPRPSVFSQSVARNGPYSARYIFHTSHFFGADRRSDTTCLSKDLFNLKSIGQYKISDQFINVHWISNLHILFSDIKDQGLV